MVAENVELVMCDESLRRHRRRQLERLAILAFEGHPPVMIAGSSDLPLCCAAVPREDDPSRLAGVIFWDVDASNDADNDKAWGTFLAEDAVRWTREHPGTEIMTGILYSIGAALHHEERCPGPLENGFVYRVLKDYPDAVEQMFAAVYRQHPQQLN